MDYDIVVSGGGIAGMAAAVAFGSDGHRVLCLDPASPVTDRDSEGADLRTTAFLQPAQGFLEDIGLWPRLAAHAMPLQVMRIIDAGGEAPEPRVTKSFDASDISDLPFGWNLPNWLLRREFMAHMNSLKTVTFRAGVATSSLFTRDREARVGLSDGTRVRCRLVIAADGRNSPMRKAAGIDVQTTRFGQKALAFAVTHPIPHDNVSTEIHRTGGPFTLVPLPDLDGQPSSAIVWMEEGPKADALMGLEQDAFETAMTERSCGVLGRLRLASRRSIWPIISQHADRLSGERIALVAEAAHVVPPIGAQGLNMSLKDLATLRDFARQAGDDVGNRTMLDRYHQKRIVDVRARVAGITLLNRTSMLGAQPLRDIRATGLDALYTLKPVRKTLMQLGLGARG
jgi:2-octaprenyl-6-methoxyphenol hydroxylase